MQLTTYTDYALRVLMYLGIKDGELATIQEIADRYGISKSHLTKVVQNLAHHGFVQSVRGKGGGLRLAGDPAAINLGRVVRATEHDLRLVQCFKPGEGRCAIEPCCVLRSLLDEALSAFLAVLDRHTLADLIVSRETLARQLRLLSPAI